MKNDAAPVTQGCSSLRSSMLSGVHAAGPMRPIGPIRPIPPALAARIRGMGPMGRIGLMGLTGLCAARKRTNTSEAPLRIPQAAHGR
jgi:hypothetical protein